MRVGDALAAATSAVGVRPCGGCKRRAEALNRAFDTKAGWSGPPRAVPEPPGVPVRLFGSLIVGAMALSLRRRINQASS
jgi:hypothetical protein